MAEQKQHEAALPSLEQLENERIRWRQRKSYRKILLNTIGILIVVAAISVLIATLFFPVLQVSGTSMEPTMEDGEILILKKTGDLETGDLVGFYYQNKILLKRVIGKAGDYIDIDKDGNVYVNNEILDEPYIREKSLGDCDIDLPYQVPDGKVFVMGDHRSTSVDSRNSAIGCVSREQLAGKVALRVWPVERIGFLH